MSRLDVKVDVENNRRSDEPLDLVVLDGLNDPKTRPGMLSIQKDIQEDIGVYENDHPLFPFRSTCFRWIRSTRAWCSSGTEAGLSDRARPIHVRRDSGGSHSSRTDWPSPLSEESAEDEGGRLSLHLSICRRKASISIPSSRAARRIRSTVSGRSVRCSVESSFIVSGTEVNVVTGVQTQRCYSLIHPSPD